MVQNYKVRTQEIKFRVFNEEGMVGLNDIFKDILKEESKALGKDESIDLVYNIIFENEMYSGDSGDEFIKLYKKYKKAKSFNVYMVKKDPEKTILFSCGISASTASDSRSYVEVYGLNETWVSGVIKKMEDLINSLPKRNRIIRNTLTEVVAQIAAVLGISTFSIIVAEYISQKIQGVYVPLYAFVITFLITSNLWTYLSQALLQLRNKLCPEVDLRTPPRSRIFPIIINFIFLGVLTWALRYILDKIFGKI